MGYHQPGEQIETELGKLSLRHVLQTLKVCLMEVLPGKQSPMFPWALPEAVRIRYIVHDDAKLAAWQSEDAAGNPNRAPPLVICFITQHGT